MRRFLLVLLGTSLLSAAALTGVAAASGPAVSITSPSSGSTVRGVVSVTATGSTDPSQSDTPQNMTFYVDGAAYNYSYTNVPCPTGTDPKSCTETFSWDTTGLTGQHTLLVKMYTSTGAIATSSQVTVTVVSPGPAVSITSPSSGSTVRGVVSVTATGSTDPSQSDTPQNMTFYVDGAAYNYSYTNVPCPTGTDPKSCTETFSWDTTGLTGQHTLLVKMYTSTGAIATSSQVTVTVVSPGPAVSITSPSSGSTVRGVVSVTATGSTDPSQSDTPQNMTFYVDGAAYNYSYTNVPCPTGTDPKSCTETFSWDTTGLTGQHTLLVKMYTSTGAIATSSQVTVTVVSPGPAVSITSPSSGSTVRGVVSVTATGSTDPSQSDTPQNMTFYVDGAAYNYSYTNVPCPTGTDPKSCTETFSWDTTGLTGQHTLLVKMYTSTGAIATSSQVTVTIYSPTYTLRISPAYAKIPRSGSIRLSVHVTVDGQSATGQTFGIYVRGPGTTLFHLSRTLTTDSSGNAQTIYSRPTADFRWYAQIAAPTGTVHSGTGLVQVR